MVLKKAVILLMVMLMLPLYGCAGSSEYATTDRSKWFEKNDKGDIVIGVAAPFSSLKGKALYREGFLLAADEFNKNGGLNGRKLKFIESDDEGSVTKGSGIAYSFVNNPSISAVIGHWNSGVSKLCAKIYDDANLTMITPSSTAVNVIEDDYRYIFRGLTNDEEMGRQIAEYAVSQNLKRVAVVYSDDDYGRNLSNAFYSATKDKGIKIVERSAGLTTDMQIKRFIEKCRAMDYDSIFIADVVSSSGGVDNFIRKVRNMGENVKIMGADGLDSADLIKNLGTQADGIVIGTHYNPERHNNKNLEFTKKFVERYGKQPDTWSATGYEAVTLLIESMKRTGSVTPKSITDYLHSLKGWEGVTGNISFTNDGEMTGKKIAKKTVVNGEFKFLTEE